MTDLGSKNPLQLAHSEYQDTKDFGTKVWGGSLNTDILGGGRKEGGRRKEEGERWAPNKAGPMRPPLLNGIKWEYQRLLIRFIQGS